MSEGVISFPVPECAPTVTARFYEVSCWDYVARVEDHENGHWVVRQHPGTTLIQRRDGVGAFTSVESALEVAKDWVQRHAQYDAVREEANRQLAAWRLNREAGRLS